MSKTKPSPERDTLHESGRLAELGLMTASLAHELRQPLFAIKSLTQLLEKQLKGQSAPLTAELLKQVAYLQCLVEGVGAYSRRSSGQAAPVDTGAVMANACELLRHRGRARGVTTDFARDAAVPPGSCDPVALLQVLVNVVNNAIDASPDEGVVTLRHRMEPGFVVITVQDEGPGVPSHAREGLFEPFYTTKEAGHGTGLGLSLSRSLIAAYGGRMDFVDCGLGAQVRILLPRA